MRIFLTGIALLVTGAAAASISLASDPSPMPGTLQEAGDLDWNPQHFWNAGRMVTKDGQPGPVDETDRAGAINALARYIFLEEGTAKMPIRTGYEVRLYRLLKAHIRESRALLTPEDVFCMAAQACRQADGVARLGLHETTYWAMLTHSRFLPNLEINFDDSQTHLRLLFELVEASSYAPGGSAPDPQKYLPATERIADKYSGIIAAILPGHGDALQKLRTSDPSATRKLLSEKIKNLIGPSTTVRATMSLAKNVKLGANQQALSGRLEYKTDSKRSSEMGANGSTEVYFGRIDEFDSLIRQGGEVTLVMSKPSTRTAK